VIADRTTAVYTCRDRAKVAPHVAPEPTELPAGEMKEDGGSPAPLEDEKTRLKPIGKARGILISTLVVLTQLVQVSYLTPSFNVLYAICPSSSC
jgi:hypothetical protein